MQAAVATVLAASVLVRIGDSEYGLATLDGLLEMDRMKLLTTLRKHDGLTDSLYAIKLNECQVFIGTTTKPVPADDDDTALLTQRDTVGGVIGRILVNHTIHVSVVLPGQLGAYTCYVK